MQGKFVRQANISIRLDRDKPIFDRLTKNILNV